MNTEATAVAPLVSVIIPTYNRAEFLREAVASVLSQTHSEFELLILDNCSPDHTPEVVASFNDPRIKYLRHQCNIGSTANWTYGVYWAQGEYLSFLGDDDRYKPDFLNHRVAAMSLSPSIVSVFGPFESWDGGDELSGPIYFPSVKNISHLQPLQGRQAVHAVVEAQFIGASLYRASTVRAIWQKATIANRAMDTLLNLLLAGDANNEVVCIPESDILYRLHSNQDSSVNVRLVSEDAARAFEYAFRNIIYKESRNFLRKRVVDCLNGLGRICWDDGNITMSARYFLEELKISPLRFVTWLRLLRCYGSHLRNMKMG